MKRFPSDLPVLYEDEWLIAVNKPAGFPILPDRDARSRLCLRALLRRLWPNAAPVSTLDIEASGVVLAAKTAETAAALAPLWRAALSPVRHLALVQGALPEPAVEIRGPLEADPDRPGRRRMAARGGSGGGLTRAETVEAFRTHALLAVRSGGRAEHQLRIHLAHIGCPLAADRLYGDGRGLFLSALKPGYRPKPDRPERPLIGRAALHAERLDLEHPVTRAPLSIAAPWPDDLRIAVKYLKKFAPRPGPVLQSEPG